MIDTNRHLEPLEDQKVYLLAELTVLPKFLDEVKAIIKQTLVPTLQEPGCEGLFVTARSDDPHKFVFFEVFSSATAHELHLAQDYTKRASASLKGKTSGLTTLTRLSGL